MLAAFEVEVVKFRDFYNIVKSVKGFKRTLLVPIKTRKPQIETRPTITAIALPEESVHVHEACFRVYEACKPYEAF